MTAKTPLTLPDPQDLAVKIGKRISTVRKILDMNQKEMAAKLNLTPSALSSIEKGVNNAGLPLIFALWEHYRVNLNFLLSGAGPMFLDWTEGHPTVIPPPEMSSIEDLYWHLDNNPIFRNVVLGQATEYFYANRDSLLECARGYIKRQTIDDGDED